MVRKTRKKSEESGEKGSGGGKMFHFVVFSKSRIDIGLFRKFDKE